MIPTRPRLLRVLCLLKFESTWKQVLQSSFTQHDWSYSSRYWLLASVHVTVFVELNANTAVFQLSCTVWHINLLRNDDLCLLIFLLLLLYGSLSRYEIVLISSKKYISYNFCDKHVLRDNNETLTKYIINHDDDNDIEIMQHFHWLIKMRL